MKSVAGYFWRGRAGARAARRFQIRAPFDTVRLKT